MYGFGVSSSTRADQPGEDGGDGDGQVSQLGAG